MNILPKKSWHVRSKRNLERVKLDEAKAAKEEKERRRQISLAEQEWRTEVLRQRNKKRKHDQIEAPPSSGSAAAIEVSSDSEPSGKVVKMSADISLMQGGHLNFFKDIEEGLRREGKNKEHEAERAAEKEKWEKNIGLLTYLGQSAIESQNEKPWYLEDPKPKWWKREDRDHKVKESMEPLRENKKNMEKRHTHDHKHRKKSSDQYHSKSSSTKHRHTAHPKSTHFSSCSFSQSQPKKSKTIEELRAERLRREAAEKQKAAAVVARVRGESSQPANDADDFFTDVDRARSRGYNSRYNPDFVKPVSQWRR